MAGFQMPEWGGMFIPDLSLAESFLRGSLVYLSLVVLFRVVLRRQGGAIGMPDLMLMVLVSECVSQSLSANARSVPNGLAAVAALLFWNFALDWLAYRWPWLRRRLELPPLQLVKDGEPIREHMKRERISDDELAAQLRLNGIDDVAKVKAAFVEAEGNVSVIPADDKGEPPAAGPEPGADEAPTNPADFERAVRRFAAAAEVVRAAVAWHEEQAADHKTAAKAARTVLARHGVRAPRPVARSPRRADVDPAEVAVRDDAG